MSKNHSLSKGASVDISPRARVPVGALVLSAFASVACAVDEGEPGLPGGGDAKLSFALNPADALTLTAQAQLEPRRQALRNVIWGTTSLPSTEATVHALTPNCTIAGLQGVASKQELRVAVDGEEELACHFAPTSSNGRLVVFNPGHACNVDDGSNGSTDAGSYGDKRAVQALLSEGYGVLVTYMPHYRPDDCPAPGGPDPHVAMFQNLHPPTGSAWQYFFAAVVSGLNYVQNHHAYSGFDMVGLSGGGWTTVVYAAVDPRIKTSVQVAGSEPMEFWNDQSDNSEQTSPALYNVAAYRDLYALGGAGSGRRQVQVLNRNDSCCFTPGWLGTAPATWQPNVRAYERELRVGLGAMGDDGVFRQEIDDAAVQHQISRNALANVVLAELGGARSRVGAANENDAFARGPNGNMWHWSAAGWADTGLALIGVPAVVLNGTHPIDLFYRDPSNALRHAWKNGSAWASEALGGVVVSDPAAVSWAPGRYDVVAFGGDYKLYHWSSAQSGFDLPVASIAGVGTPTLVSSGSNTLDAVFREPGGAVGRLFWNGASWGSESLGGQIVGFPSAAVTSGPVRRVYALGLDYRLYENAKVGAGSWSGWQSVSAAAGATATPLAGAPKAVVRADGVVVVHVRTRANGLAIFARPSSWNVTMPAGATLAGVPTPLPSGASWAGDAATNSLLLYSSGGAWSSKSGDVE